MYVHLKNKYASKSSCHQGDGNACYPDVGIRGEGQLPAVGILSRSLVLGQEWPILGGVVIMKDRW